MIAHTKKRRPVTASGAQFEMEITRTKYNNRPRPAQHRSQPDARTLRIARDWLAPTRPT